MSELPRKTAPRFSAGAREKLAAALGQAGLAAGLAAGLVDGGRVPRRVDRASPWPLSSSQERLWLAERLLGPTPLYHVPLAAQLFGPLDVDALQRVLASLVRRHELLRARFIAEEERVFQLTSPADEFALPRVDLSGLPAEERLERALELAREELRRPFDLQRGPPLRAALWRLDGAEHVLLVTLHHIVCDGETIRLLGAEIEELYAAEREHRPARLPAPELQHGDYALWERSRRGSEEERAALAYWEERLRGPVAPLELPCDRPSAPADGPGAWDVAGGWRTRALEPALAAAVAELARARAATPFQVFLAALHVLLHRLTGSSDVLVGIPIGLRERAELERLPGFLVNTLALRTRVDGSLRFAELLERVRETALEATTHRAAPFELVLERAGLRSSAGGPLVRVMFDHRSGLAGGLCLAGLTGARPLREDELHSGTSKVDLALYSELDGERASLSAEYRSALFDAATVERLLASYATLLAAITADPFARVDELPLLSAAERALVADTWARGPELAGCAETVHAAVAGWAARAGERVALEHGDERVSYAELEARANQLARHLAGLGVERGEPVALCLARSSALVVAELAIMKAGGAYLPLDPNYPVERLRFMLADSGARLLVTEESLVAGLPLDTVRAVVLERERDALARHSPAAPERSCAGPDDPAYLIYTSGSTGTPKGVPCPHRGVLRLFRGSDWLSFERPVRMVHLAPESFDASVLDTWGPLVSGGTLILHPERTPTLAGLVRVIAEHDVDTLFLTTALFHALVDESPQALARLSQVATGGEALSLAHLRKARAHCPDLHIANCYGPTEATVIATRWVVPRELAPELASPPIGTPIANTCAYVLDERLVPVPIGVAGELYVGGPSIARGYWKRPELSAQRFVPDPFGPSGLLYRTGDLVRWRADGEIEYLGRGDDQVKIRGHRVELGEIEARLAEHARVRRALVVAREDGPGAKRLVAYVVAAEERPSPAELAAHMAARVPEYLRPSAFVLLDELPLTPGGKLDRARLPAPEVERVGGEREEPRGTTEEILAGLWGELLGVAEVGRRDDFFALGGHSLSATVLIARVGRHFGVELPLATLFRERTLETLARAITAAQGSAPGTLPIPRTEQTTAPLSFNQRGLWFLQQLAPESPSYNVPCALPLRGALDVAALARGLEAVVERHAILRSTFPVQGGDPVQLVGAPRSPLGTLDLRTTAAEARADARRVALEAFAREPFDLERDTPLRALLVRTADDEATLALNLHHIACDGWSLDVLLDDLRRCYAACARGSAPELAPLPIQFADYALWQRRELTPEREQAELEFWRRELEGAPFVLELATDRPRPALPSWNGGRVQRVLGADLVERVRALARSAGATPYLVALTCAEVLLARYAGAEDLVLGTPVAARAREECQRSIGLFLNVVPIRARLDGDPSFRELLARTRERVLAAHAHQDFPFERLVDALQESRDPAITPIYQVLFSLRRQPRAAEAAGLVFEPAQEIDARTAKTDLAITLEERDGDWLLDLSFAADLFDAATLERFGEHFENLLASALADPGRPVSALELVGPEERRRLLAWSGATPEYPRAASLAELFARAVARSPDAVALVYEQEEVRYRELDQRSGRLARRLVELGVGRGSRVALCAGRSPRLLVGLLAILKAGGAYVPLDPGYPAERLAFMLTDSGASVLLVDADLRDELPPSPARIVVLEEVERELAGSEPLEAPPARSTGEDLAYVMYTSGSTGRPKGVQIPQRAISRLVFGADYVRLDASRTLLLLAPISFDAATLEIWGALLHGGRLVLFPERLPSAEELERVLAEKRVTTLWLTAALFNAVVDERPQALAHLDECITGGEALSVAHVRRAHEHLPGRVQLVNGYGPTENTTFTCCYRIPRELPEELTSIPIGTPIANTKVYVVDRAAQLVPIGVPGELVTGGDGLARGYLGRPELDAERFLPDPFSPPTLERGRLYRTGDRVRWLAHGVLEFLGRNDDQVKIRGHRIEPGEIAAVLGAHPRVRKAFVAVHETAGIGKSLAAYYEAQDGGAPPGADELASWLSERLPAYMVPASFTHLDALPVSPNGKVDRRRLPEPVLASRASEGPRNDLERHLASLWQDVLGVDTVGAQDDFFELGGHSLLAVRLVQAIRDAFGQELELGSLIGAPTLAEQAQLLHEGVGSKRSSALVKLHTTGNRPPVFCVCSLGGTVLNQRPLAMLLGPEQPFYGLQAIDLEARLGRPARIEEYAAAYIEAMKSVAPRGPYVIGGHSFGGIVSFEIAQQLTSRGDQVDMLFILDSSLPNLDKGALDRLSCVFTFLRGLPYLPVEAWGQVRRDPEQLGRALRQKLRFVQGKARGAWASPKPAAHAAAAAATVAAAAAVDATDRGALPLADVVEMTNWPENNRRIAQRHWRAVLDYRPQAYPGRITLFRSRFQSPFLGLGNQMGWERVALGGVEVVRVPGGHLTVLQPPNVEVLARRLRERLARKRRAA